MIQCCVWGGEVGITGEHHVLSVFMLAYLLQPGRGVSDEHRMPHHPPGSTLTGPLPAGVCRPLQPGQHLLCQLHPAGKKLPPSAAAEQMSPGLTVTCPALKLLLPPHRLPCLAAPE